MIRVLIAEDSPTLCELLVTVLQSQGDIQVVGTAADGERSVDLASRLKPDVVTMDIHMPKLNGFEATRKIMESHPVPIVIVSSTLTDDMAATFRAVDAGAVAFVRRPHGVADDRYAESADHLVQTVRLMAQIKVVRRWRRPEPPRSAKLALPPPKVSPGPRKLVVIGASTGGPLVLQTIFAALPAQFPLPILVVQHMTPGFVQSFVDWLASTSRLTIRVARDGERPEPGHVYIAPDHKHLAVGPQGTIVLADGPPENRLRPAVSHLFRSAVQQAGADVIAILLSGMGMDGAAELRLLREAGAITLAQDAASSVVHGMPGAAIALDGATHVLSPEEIPPLLLRLTSAPS